MNPITSDLASGIIIIGGKLATGAPTAGVIGIRVLLGKVRFTHSGATMPPILGLTYGRDPSTISYENFVTVNGTIEDNMAVTFSHPTFGVPIKILERGDVNADNNVDLADVSAARFHIKNPGVVRPWMDCNADGKIDLADTSCIRFMIKNP